eukprot:CAMPEP_0196827310 /NCGR_PEP_ID=MMETSP1362-20130617/94090_1 /TAXON_ID=163516 /ORGANISM="Leptocylindrus danicus, Strain CCMP1856" /LENGTH=1784 /DNA_ID=CAMNT_0042207939 /DNA_START=135 /DNA_END=5489 /DNA_ORIENTATION=+
MFGQTSGFGAPSPASTPFGQSSASTTTTPAFGQSSNVNTGFGSAAPSAFGAPAVAAPVTSPFGAAAPAAPAFGASPAPATGGFGGFGSSTATTPAFGTAAPAPATGGLFGSAAPAASTGGFGGFGSSSTTGGGGGGLFGSAAPAAPATGGLFGSTAPAPSTGGLFGAPAPAPATGGLFGSSNSTSSGGLFGSSNTTTTTSPFGAATSSATSGGGGVPVSAAQPYQASTVADGNTRIHLQSITAMPTFSNVSFEELRVSDYLSGNKGSTAANSTNSGGFGAAAPAFGASPAPGTGGFGGFGSSTTSTAFGTAAPAPGGLFGTAPAPAAGGLFGAPAVAPAATGGLFGAAPAAAPSTGGLFGAAPTAAPSTGFGGFGSAAPATATGGLFGSAAPAPAATGGLFGSTAPAPSTGGLFGAPAPAPSTGGLFGSTAAPAPATGGLFGAAAPAPSTGGFGGFGSSTAGGGGGGFGGFGKSPAPAAPAPGGGFGLFGATNTPAAPAPAPGGGFGLFGSTATAPTPAPGTAFAGGSSGGLFGAAAPAPSTGGFGLFGSTAPAPAGTAITPGGGGLFGSTATAAPIATPMAAAAATMVQQPTAQESLEQKMALIEQQRQYNAKLEPWRNVGAAAYSTAAAVNGTTHPTAPPLTSAAAASATSGSAAMMPRSTHTPKSLAKIRPRGYTPPSAHTSTYTSSNAAAAAAVYAYATPSRGVTSPDQYIHSYTNGSVNGNVGRIVNDGSAKRLDIRKDVLSTPSTLALVAAATATATPKVKHRLSSIEAPTQQVQVQPQPQQVQPVDTPVKVTTCTPLLSKKGYSTQPSLEALASYSEAELAAVTGFTVQHDTNGSIAWEGAVDVRNVDIDAAVVIGNREAIVYHEDNYTTNKPAVGEKLNRPAIITLNNVRPKGTGDRDHARYAAKISSTTAKMGGKLISYDANTGIWVFRVEHFSRYGIDDTDTEDEDDDDDEENVDPQQQLLLLKQDSDSHYYSPRKTKAMATTTHFVAPTAATASTDNSVTAEDSDDEDEDVVMQSAEAAFGALMDHHHQSDYYYDDHDHDNSTLIISSKNKRAVCLELDEIAINDDDDYYDDDAAGRSSRRRYCVELLQTLSTTTAHPPPSYCQQILKKRMNAGMLTTSTSKLSTDVSLRMQRSFRPCFSPRGKLVTVSPSGRITFSTPILSQSTSTSTSLLKIHKEHSICVKDNSSDSDSGCPRYTLPASIQQQHGHDCYAHASLCSLIGHYASSNVDGAVFGLLDALYGQEEDVHLQQEPAKQMLPQSDNETNHGHAPPPPSLYMRRIAALQQWLRINANEITRTATTASISVYARILKALHSHNTVEACHIATEHKLYHLATMLATTAVEDSVAMAEQLQLWDNVNVHHHTNEHAVWTILGDANAVYEHADVSDILKEYLRSTDGDTNHIVYRLLKCYMESDSNSLVYLCHPRGYASTENFLHDVHDMSLGWHVWQLLAALGVGGNEVGTSSSASIRLLEGMVTQLIQADQWHWAVYLSLASHGVPRQHAVHIAKGLVLQNYINSSRCEREHTFLVDEVGVPDRWFEEALAQHAGFTGNITARVQHLGKAKLFDECTALIRSCVIPQCMFNGGKDRDMVLRTMLTNMADCIEGAEAGENRFWSDRLGCGTMLQLIQVQERVWNMLSNDQGDCFDSDDQVDDILDEVEALHSRMVVQLSNSDDENGDGLRTDGEVLLACSTLPQYELEAGFIAETLRLLSFLRLQLSLFVREPSAGEQLLKMTFAQLIEKECAATGIFSVDCALALDMDRAMRGIGAYVGA